MAIQEQLDILQQGVEEWNAWRKRQLTTPIDLSGADLSGADLSGAFFREADIREAHLGGANLSGANLSRADLYKAHFGVADLSGADLSEAFFREADLNRANLSRANIREADFLKANLSRANLSRANLSGATLYGADLNGADLVESNFSKADLLGVDLRDTILYGANLSEARIGWTIFGNLDLRTVKGLETIQHKGPSTIGADTLERSEGDIPEVFLGGVGLSETFITYVRSLAQSPIQYYTCFISYSSKDQKFAERLHADLQQQGIRCWFAPKDLKIGEEFPRRIEEAIRLYDKLLIILSENSLDSSWVEDEARLAMEKEAQFKEKQLNQTVLFPIKIDTSIENCQSKWVTRIRGERHIGDFTRWKYHTRYEKAFQRLLRDLQPD